MTDLHITYMDEETSVDDLLKVVEEQNKRIEDLEQSVSELESDNRKRRDAIISSQSAMNFEG